jgi:ZIP family zinc transporter
MGAAIGWGALAASSLVIGAVLAFARDWSPRQTGTVLAFGAGALISAVSFELVEEGTRVAGLRWVALGLGVGAITYFLADGAVSNREKGGRGRDGRASGGAAGTSLALGAFLDGIPEQMVLGIGLAAGEGVGVGLIVAIFVSNLPEAIGSANQMRAAGSSEGKVLKLWIAVAVICLIATVVGYAIADVTGDELRAAVNGFAGGALLVMLIDSMIPDATKDAGRIAGLVTVLGFAVAFALSSLS